MDINQSDFLQFTLINSQGQINPDLLKLLELLKVRHSDNLSSIIDSIKSKDWFRKVNEERWQVDEIVVKNKKHLFEIFEKLKLSQEIVPRHRIYDFALVFGSISKDQTERFSYLIDLWNSGIRFQNLIFLTGLRPRINEQEPDSDLFLDSMKNHNLEIKINWKSKGELPNNESEMMKFIFDQVLLPKDFKEIVRVDFVDTNMKNIEGRLIRPNTEDTINEWLNTNPNPCNCLFVSNNPFIGYQDAVARKLLANKNFNIETVGPKAQEDEKIVYFLDSIVRWLIQYK